VAEWLEEASEEHIHEILEYVVKAGTWHLNGAVIQAIRTVQREMGVAKFIKCGCDDLRSAM
jgi:hypothetical protein